MYRFFLRTPSWAVWQAEDDSRVSHVRPEPPPTLWADEPLRIPKGVCLGVRLRDGEIEVCVRQGTERRWRKARDVLTEAQAKAWSRGRFRAPRRR